MNLRLIALLPFVAAGGASAAPIYTTVFQETRTLSGMTNFNPGFGPTTSFEVPQKRNLGLDDDVVYAAPAFSIDVTDVEFFIDYLFESDVTVSGNLAPTMTVTAGGIFQRGPASDTPISVISGRYVRDVTPALSTGGDCSGAFTYCYEAPEFDLGPSDFAGLTADLAEAFGTSVVLPGGETVTDFSSLEGQSLRFGALGFDREVVVNNPPVSGNAIVRFLFSYDVTYRQDIVESAPPSVVPVPAGIVLLAGALGLAGVARRLSPRAAGR